MRASFRYCVLPESLEERRLFSAAYRIFDLGALGGENSQGNGINSRGHVAMEAMIADGTLHAARYAAGKLADLGTLAPDGDTHATAINDAEIVAGYGVTADGFDHAFVQKGKTLADLGTLGGSNSHAFGINNAGSVVGDADLIDPELGETTHAFLRRAGKMQDLGTLGGPFSGAAAINGSGQVAGFAALPPDSTGDIPDHAFIYTGGKLKDIGTLPGNRDSEAFGINSKGWVVGTSENPLGPAHAFLYRDGKMTDLGTLAGGQSFANAVNDDGIVVGDSLVATSTHHAFIYRGGKLRDLNGLIDTKSGWTLVSATGINNLGKITGVGLIHGQEHAFLLVPARIEGLVYRDANANGRRDAAEKGLAGVKVFIDLVGDGKFRTTDPTAITDANGHYSFGSLDAGHYEIRVVRPSGFATTAPKNGLRTVDLSLGELQTGVRFGLIASNVG